jgi:fatty-acyl-CoA synthase
MSSPAIEVPVLYVERLVEILAKAVDRPCLNYRGQDIRASEFLACIHRFARALDGRGIGRGDLVAIFAPNHPDALAVRYAANLIGAGSTFLSDAGTTQTRAELIKTLDPKLVVVFAQTAALVPAAITVRTAGVGITPPGGFDLKAAAAEQSSEAVACRAMPKDLAVVVSSGGSTGVPKGSWRTFVGYSAMVTVASPADRRQLVNGPLAYLSQVLVDMTLLGGGTVVFRDRYEAADTLATIGRERITDLFLVEPQLFDLMDHPRLASTDLSSLRTLTHIGASAPSTLRRRARERFGPRIVHTYGASEEGLVSTLGATQAELVDDERRCSAGIVMPRVELRFRRKDGTLAERGEVGSIEVRSPGMAMGYRHRPDLEALAFQDGWYRSGDLGRLDEDGYLHILGRAVDVEIVEGRMISPTLIEDTLCQVPGIRYASVVVDPDASRRVAVVLPLHGAKVDEKACRDAVAAELGEAVAASLILLARAFLPLTPQGKPDREAIRALGRALPDR